MNKLNTMGKLDNTYFIYNADRGFHVGQYGMTFGKRLLYDTDLRVPFYVSGPTVKKNGATAAMALNIDIAPTIIELALGADSIPSNMDGRSLVEFFDLSDDDEAELATKKQAFLVECNGESPPSDPEMSTNDFQIVEILVLVHIKVLMLIMIMLENQVHKVKVKVNHKVNHNHDNYLQNQDLNLWIMNCESQV